MRHPANLGGGGWAGECRQASGGLGADRVVSCGRDSRVLSRQSSAGQVGLPPALQILSDFLLAPTALPPIQRAVKSCHNVEWKAQPYLHVRSRAYSHNVAPLSGGLRDDVFPQVSRWLPLPGVPAV